MWGPEVHNFLAGKLQTLAVTDASPAIPFRLQQRFIGGCDEIFEIGDNLCRAA